MTSLVIVDVTPINIEKLLEYSALAEETLLPFHGRFIAKGNAETLHTSVGQGGSGPSMKAVIEFPNSECANAWYASPEYQALIPLREQGMSSRFQLLDGI